MKTSLIIAVLFIANLAQARQVVSSERGETKTEPTMAVCSITRISLINNSVNTEVVHAPLIFNSSSANTGAASVNFDSSLMPSYKIQFDISFANNLDSTRLMTVNKENGKAISQYASNNILMNFVSGSGECYKVNPSNAFATKDGKFVFDITCHEKID